VKPGITSLARWGVALGLLAAWAVATHRATAAAAPASLGALLAVAPPLAIAAAMSWRSPHRGWWLALLAVACAVLWNARALLEHHFEWLLFAQHAGTNLMLGIAFWQSLGAGREALCTRFARAVHGELPPDVMRYTRRVTVAWTTFFLAMAAASTALFAAGRMEAWSVLANLLTLPLVALMFAAEYAVRRRALPNFRHGSLLDGVRSYRAAGSAPTSQPR